VNKVMIVSLIQAKMKSHPEERTLTQEILDTVDLVESSLGFHKRQIYTSALMHSTANYLSLDDIVNGLRRGSRVLHRDSNLVENALVAALLLDCSNDIQVWLDQGAKGQSPTEWFGDPLTVASCHAQSRTLELLIRSALATQDIAVKRLVSLRQISALRQAAAKGRDDIFCAEIWASMEENVFLLSYTHILPLRYQKRNASLQR
jgi:hypothetical protein